LRDSREYRYQWMNLAAWRTAIGAYIYIARRERYLINNLLWPAQQASMMAHTHLGSNATRLGYNSGRSRVCGVRFQASVATGHLCAARNGHTQVVEYLRSFPSVAWVLAAMKVNPCETLTATVTCRSLSTNAGCSYACCGTKCSADSTVWIREACRKLQLPALLCALASSFKRVWLHVSYPRDRARACAENIIQRSEDVKTHWTNSGGVNSGVSPQFWLCFCSKPEAKRGLALTAYATTYTKRRPLPALFCPLLFTLAGLRNCEASSHFELCAVFATRWLPSPGPQGLAALPAVSPVVSTPSPSSQALRRTNRTRQGTTWEEETKYDDGGTHTHTTHTHTPAHTYRHKQAALIPLTLRSRSSWIISVDTLRPVVRVAVERDMPERPVVNLVERDMPERPVVSDPRDRDDTMLPLAPLAVVTRDLAVDRPLLALARLRRADIIARLARDRATEAAPLILPEGCLGGGPAPTAAPPPPPRAGKGSPPGPLPPPRFCPPARVDARRGNKSLVTFLSCSTRFPRRCLV